MHITIHNNYNKNIVKKQVLKYFLNKLRLPTLEQIFNKKESRNREWE